jgi:hypothetical protein
MIYSTFDITKDDGTDSLHRKKSACFFLSWAILEFQHQFSINIEVYQVHCDLIN